MRNLFLMAGFEFRAMRIYWFQLLIAGIVMPLALMVTILLAQSGSGERLPFLLTGFIASSIASTFLNILALRVVNIMQPDVLELYAALGFSRRDMVASFAIFYSMFLLPQTIVASVLALHWAGNPGMVAFPVAIVGCALFMGVLAITLGLRVRNYFHAMGIFPCLSWAMIMLSPAYYPMSSLPVALQALMWLNPLTHCLNIAHHYIGCPDNIPVSLSVLLLSVSFCFMAARMRASLLKTYILENI